RAVELDSFLLRNNSIAKMDELRQKIWDKLRGKSSKVDEALGQIEQGDRAVLATIARNLDVAMDEHPDFAREMQIIAQEINAGKLPEQSSMTQYNSSQATGWQVRVERGDAYIGEVPRPEKSPKADG